MIRSSRGAAILLLAFLSAATTGLRSGIARPPRVLDLEERVEAERAIQTVLWRHRIWPAENAAPKPPLSEVMSDEVLHARVVDYLKKSKALEEIWQRPIEGSQLQAEMERMAKGSRDPVLLREILEALGNDPLVVAECLARPALADRLVQNWYAGDGRFQGEIRERASTALARAVGLGGLAGSGAEYRETTWRLRGSEEAREQPASKDDVLLLEPEEWAERSTAVEDIPVGRIGALEEDGEGYTATAVLSRTHDSIRVATARWPKVPFTTWWTAQAKQTAPVLPIAEGAFTLALPGTTSVCATPWSAIRPEWRYRWHPAIVWTGAEMIVWGGTTTAPIGYLDSGARYNPATDTWAAMERGPGTPSPRLPSAPAVWTGTEMIVWGATYSDSTGGRYNPTTDSWVPTSTGTNAPSPRGDASAVWTGSEMIVWGGQDAQSQSLATGARYAPASDTWATVAPGPLGPRAFHTAVWTGTEMIVWGGSPALSTGARYDPSTNAWHTTAPGPTGRASHTAVWTGSRMVVWGGSDGSGEVNTGSRYDPSTNTWSATSSSGAPEARSIHTVVWTGDEMIVWGGVGRFALLNTGGRYDPVENTWVALPVTGAPLPRDNHRAVWTGTEMIVWGPDTNGGRYSRNNDSWVPMNGGLEPIPRNRHRAVWTGTEMIVWGDISLRAGGRYEPATDKWSQTPISAATPAPRSSCTAVWTGTEMIVWGGDVFPGPLNTGGRYDPATDTWRTTATGPLGRTLHTAVWTGSRMIVWGGEIAGGPTNSGGSYDPATDSWTATQPGAPAPRTHHTAVWTGSRMIVWGGETSDGDEPIVNTGGVYDPASGVWSAMTLASAPSPRMDHTAVWSGSQMIVWGGWSAFPNDYLGNGARFDPVQNHWTSISGTGAPNARSLHTAVWTGYRMLVWGGQHEQQGGTYDPAADQWVPIPVDANTPAARIEHTAIWTGSEMIVWGGYTGAWVGDGGRYCACPQQVVSYLDADGDGFGQGAAVLSCDGAIPTGHATQAGDCDDANPAIHPGAAEICDGSDDDCDGLIEDFDPGFCDDAIPCTSDFCNPSVGCVHTGNAGACDDANPCTVDSCQSGAGCVHAPGGDCVRDPRGLGYWTRLCSGEFPPGEALDASDLQCFSWMCTFAGIGTVGELCDRLRPDPPADPCAQADAELLSVMLNLCRGRLEGANPIHSPCTSSTTVSAAVQEADAFLCGTRDSATCAVARCQAAEVATGHALDTDRLRLEKIPGGVRLGWSPPYSPDVGAPTAYTVWRRADPSLPFVVAAQVQAPEWTDPMQDPYVEYEIRWSW